MNLHIIEYRNVVKFEGWWQPTLGDPDQKPKFILHYFISFTKMGNLTRVTNPGQQKGKLCSPKFKSGGRGSTVSPVLTACLEQGKPNSFVLIHSLFFTSVNNVVENRKQVNNGKNDLL